MVGEWERDLTFIGTAEAYFQRAELWQEEDTIPTPWPAINRTCGGMGGWAGMAPGWYVVLGGASGAGKSLAALQMATQAIKRGRNVGFVSLEMSADQLATRLYAMLFGVKSREISPGRHYRPEVAQQVTEEIQKRKRDGMGSFYVNERRIRNLPDIMALMAAWRDGWSCSMMVLDYMQLCRVPGEDQTHRRIQEVSAQVCDWAHDTETTTVALSQFHSQARRDKQTPPTMDSLYGGVDLGNDADLMLLLDHSRYHRESDDLARTWLIHAKNREGPQADDLPVLWDYRTLTLTEAMPHEEHLWPGAEI